MRQLYAVCDTKEKNVKYSSGSKHELYSSTETQSYWGSAAGLYAIECKYYDQDYARCVDTFLFHDK